MRFRLIVFKPFKGEVLLGKVAAASAIAGIQGVKTPLSLYLVFWLDVSFDKFNKTPSLNDLL